jgi:Tol biopolymer transport system component
MWRPEFSPDLTKLGIVQFEEGQLAVIDARTGAEATLATSPDEFRWAWSPDSRQIVFQTSEGIFTIDAPGTNRRQIATGSLVLLGDPWQAEVSR